MIVSQKKSSGMSKLFQQLRHDERGAVSPMALILVTTLLALGATVGLTTLRDQLVQEFDDVAQALENVDQSFSQSTTSFFNDDSVAVSCISVTMPP